MRTSISGSPLRFRGLKIAQTWKCNAACEHCAVAAGPRRVEHLGLPTVLDCISDAASLGLATIEVTGGEAFLASGELTHIILRATELGLVSIVDTNAFWALTHKAALARLKLLRQAGLRSIVISTDRWHQKFVPLDRVLYAIDAARELGIGCSVTICVLANDHQALDTVWPLRERGITVKLQSIVPVGRAVTIPAASMLTCSFAEAAMPCENLYFPTVGPDGRVTICCAPPQWFPRTTAELCPLCLGWLAKNSLREILAAAQDSSLLNALASLGIGGLYERLSESGREPINLLQRRYFGRCDLCTTVLTNPTYLTPLLSSPSLRIENRGCSDDAHAVVV